MQSIYLDHNATTATRPEVVEVVSRALADIGANPASQHHLGQAARRRLEAAREKIATLIGAKLVGAQADRLIFTSGGTEANNLAVLGIAATQDAEPAHLVVSAVEHPSVLQSAEALLERGWQLDLLGVTGAGVAIADRLGSLLKPTTKLVSVMLANHDTGAIQPVESLAAVCREAGVPLHTDAVQAAGKIPIDFRQLNVAALSIAAHKFAGPLGVGALVLRHDVAVTPQSFGGSQQGGLRPGTESVPLAEGMALALELALAEREQYAARVEALRTRFEAGVRAGFPGLVVNAADAPRLANTANLGFPGLDGQLLLVAFDLSGVACSVGAACSSGSTELSPTLRAMGLANHLVASSLRFSLGRTTTEQEVDEAVARIVSVCRQLSTD